MRGKKSSSSSSNHAALLHSFLPSSPAARLKPILSCKVTYKNGRIGGVNKLTQEWRFVERARVGGGEKSNIGKRWNFVLQSVRKQDIEFFDRKSLGKIFGGMLVATGVFSLFRKKNS